ncbi:hypothetical protein C8Q75DRAFT_135645 [Abortiporus biennis]|nr:hypothetical protein C8Q75DRAFT_135645 [Abortiporus biennis]
MKSEPLSPKLGFRGRKKSFNKLRGRTSGRGNQTAQPFYRPKYGRYSRSRSRSPPPSHKKPLYQNKSWVRGKDDVNSTTTSAVTESGPSLLNRVQPRSVSRAPDLDRNVQNGVGKDAQEISRRSLADRLTDASPERGTAVDALVDQLIREEQANLENREVSHTNQDEPEHSNLQGNNKKKATSHDFPGSSTSPRSGSPGSEMAVDELLAREPDESTPASTGVKDKDGAQNAPPNSLHSHPPTSIDTTPVPSSSVSASSKVAVLADIRRQLIPVIVGNAKLREPDADSLQIQQKLNGLLTDEHCVEFANLAKKIQIQIKAREEREGRPANYMDIKGKGKAVVLEEQDVHSESGMRREQPSSRYERDQGRPGQTRDADQRGSEYSRRGIESPPNVNAFRSIEKEVGYSGRPPSPLHRQDSQTRERTQEVRHTGAGEVPTYQSMNTRVISQPSVDAGHRGSNIESPPRRDFDPRNYDEKPGSHWNTQSRERGGSFTEARGTKRNRSVELVDKPGDKESLPTERPVKLPRRENNPDDQTRIFNVEGPNDNDASSQTSFKTRDAPKVSKTPLLDDIQNCAASDSIPAELKDAVATTESGDQSRIGNRQLQHNDAGGSQPPRSGGIETQIPTTSSSINSGTDLVIDDGEEANKVEHQRAKLIERSSRSPGRDVERSIPHTAHEISKQGSMVVDVPTKLSEALPQPQRINSTSATSPSLNQAVTYTSTSQPPHPILAFASTELPSDSVPGVWFITAGNPAADILDLTFEIGSSLAGPIRNWSQRDQSFDMNAKHVSLHLLCLPAEVTLVQNTLSSSSPHSTFVSMLWNLQTKWPRKGKLVITINPDAEDERSFLPVEIVSV